MLTLTGRLPSREEVINHNILIIKGTKVDLAVRQVYLNRGHWVQSVSMAGITLLLAYIHMYSAPSRIPQLQKRCSCRRLSWRMIGRVLSLRPQADL